MDISNKSRENIADEIKIAVNMMRDSKDASEKLFYFSAIHGVLQRTYNIDYDDDLVFAHLVMTAAQQAFSQRLGAIKQGEGAIMIADEQFDRLTDLSEELGNDIQNDKDVADTLRKIVILAYSTQGNGYYLMKKGVLKI